MATRTVQFIGWAYSTNPTTVTATYDGNTVFSSTVTLNGDVYPGNDPDLYTPPLNVLFTFDIPVETEGNIPMTVQTTDGMIVLGPVLSNYNSLPQDLTKYPDYTTGTATGYAEIYHTGDSRSEVTVDGIAQTPPIGALGDIWWRLSPGDVLGFNLNINAGVVTP